MATARVEPSPGIVLIDKPGKWTSHDVVSKLRSLALTKKVGHAGTLDPMATGLLVLGIGKATKLLTYIVGVDKEYAATIRLGQATVTDDADGEVTSEADASRVDDERLHGAVTALTGAIMQVPSSVSAIKVDGQRSYARVRGGQDVTLAPRPVTVSRFEILEVRRHGAVVDVDVEVEVSSGTYVRALARDLGGALGVGGHLTALRRTRVGPWTVQAAHRLDDLMARADDPVPLVPLAQAAREVLPVLSLSEAEARALSYGQLIDAILPPPATAAAAIAPDGDLVAIVSPKRAKVGPEIVFTPARAQ